MYLKIAVKSQTPVLSSFQPLRKQSRLSGLLWSVNVLTVFNGVLTRTKVLDVSPTYVQMW